MNSSDSSNAYKKNSFSPYEKILDMTYVSLINARAIYAAVKLGIPDLIKESIFDYGDIARRVGAHPASIYRLMRALANADILVEQVGKKFLLTPLGETLCSAASGSMRDWVLFSGESFYQDTLQEIVHSICTGEPAWNKVHGKSFFEFLRDNHEASNVFDKAMTSLSGREAEAIADAYDFSGLETLVDIGGGRGTLLLRILETHKHVQGILFDQHQVVSDARNYISKFGLYDRCEIRSGDFFESIPDGADAYILKYIIHDWSDNNCVTILKNCRRSMSPTSKLLLIETVIPDVGVSHISKVQDLDMLILLGGQERTLEQYSALLCQVGLKLERIIPTSELVSIIEAVVV